MPTPRKPQDHKPKQDEVDEEEFVSVTIEVPTGEVDDDGKPISRTVPARRGKVRGIEVTVPEEALDDFEVLDDIRAAQDEEDASRLPALLRRLVGDEYRRVIAELKKQSPTGRVTVQDGTEFVFDLIQRIAPNS